MRAFNESFRASLLFISLFALLACNQTLPKVEPESVGLSSKRLERINVWAESYIDEGKLSGMVTMVARRGKVAHFEHFGVMDIESGNPIQDDTIFRIYSMTKPITAVAMMILYEEGHYQLGDRVSKYIPEFKDLKVYNAESGEFVKPRQQMQIRDLLTHTSGLTYGIFGNTFVDSMYRDANILGQKNLQVFIEKLSKIPLVNHPGEKWHYGVSTDVLGYLVEVLSGESLDEFFQKRIFDPLKMVDTGFYVPVEKHERFITNYTVMEDGSLDIADATETSMFSKPTTFYSGGGGLVSTASDYMQFAQMLLNDGELDGVRILSPKTVDLMTMDHMDGEFRPGYGFAFCGSVTTNVARGKIIGSEGIYSWSGMANTHFFIDPIEDLAAVMMAQFLPTEYYPLRDYFKVAVYQAIIN